MTTSASLLTMPGFKHHIFICTNQREPGSPRGCCNPNGNAELHKAFKDAIAARGLKATVRANKSGCLDQCEHGPNVVVYPEAVWYGRVMPEDVGYLARQVTKKLIEGEFIDTKNVNATIERVNSAVLEEMQLEDRINDEVRMILEAYQEEMRTTGASYQEMFKKVKQQLVQKYKAVL